MTTKKYTIELSIRKEEQMISSNNINDNNNNIVGDYLQYGVCDYLVLLKNYSFAIRSGIEQRDAAIKMGAMDATTLLYKDHKFVMPGAYSSKDLLQIEPHIANDMIIIGSDNKNSRIAEFGAKNAALFTIMDHETHRAFTT